MQTTTADATHGNHPRFLAHHFQSPAQQFDAGKLGMWLFLVTEVLFFSGLFAAYAVYRHNHPEVFVYAHQFLDKSLGALNTLVLLLSSLTMAWAVRSAQLGRQRSLLVCLLVTLACAGFFLGVKAVEYTHKWHEGLLWAGAYQFTGPKQGSHATGHYTPALGIMACVVGIAALLAAAVAGLAHLRGHKQLALLAFAKTAIAIALLAGIGCGLVVPSLSSKFERPDRMTPAVSTTPHQATVAAATATATPAGGIAGKPELQGPRLAGVFFSIYYAMTGVHAIHILAGMGVMLWLLSRSAAGHFGPDYFGPVDFVGLYWHLVDLVWIYLFPLLYLIH